MTTRRTLLSQAAGAALALLTVRESFAAAVADTMVDPRLLARAAALLAKAPFLDTHNDLPTSLLEAGGGDLTRFDLGVRQPALCADLPALRAGGVRAQYWSVFVESSSQRSHDALHQALGEFDVALRLMRSRPEFEQARTAADIERIAASGRIACLLGVEGGHMIENSPAVLRVFFDLGARYMTLTHWDNVDWADAATDRPAHYGLSPLGRGLIAEMNRLGLFVDLSHVSADTMRDALHLSRAPVIFSHSNAFALNPHPRNVPDDVLRLVRDNGGVVHVNFVRRFVSPQGQAWVERREAALREIRGRLRDDAAIEAAIKAWESAVGPPTASIGDVADHIEHIRGVAGIDHIGIGADFYNADASNMASGLGSVSRYPYLFAELLKRGYSDEDVMKIAGRNHLRAMRRMEQVAADQQRTQAPLIDAGARPPT